MKAILFDLDDTLIPEAAALQAGYDAVAERVWGAGSPERTESLREAARAVWRTGPPDAYATRVHFDHEEGLHGDLTAKGPEAEALRAFLPALHAQAFEAALPPAARGTSPELVDLWRTARIRALAPFPETLDVLEHWAARLPLALVTNGVSRLQRDKLAVTGIGGYFSVVVASEEIGVGKPDPAMFQAALSAVGVAADEVVMVGNDLDRDVAGARNAGIRPIHVDRNGGSATTDVVADLTQLEDLLTASRKRRPPRA
jgi:putative hydrolase of the HAD superfamily